MKKLEGVLIPAVTPFDGDGSLRLDWLKENYEYWNRTDVSGCMALGSNGEFRSLSDEESLEVIRVASQTISSEKIFMAGVARESLYQTLEFIRKLTDAGIEMDFASVLTPSYFRKAMKDDALIDYYTAVADACPWPVVLYCAPGFANEVYLSEEAVRRLADHPNIVGIKDTSADMMPSYLEAVGGRDDFAVLSGTLGKTMVCLSGGGNGGVLSAANYFPQTCAKLYRVFRTCGAAEADLYFEELRKLAACTGGLGGVAGVKAAMNMMGRRGGFPRNPLQPCKESIQSAISSGIEAFGEMLCGSGDI